jgi:DNA-binding transcriptional ArsR family regulator
MQVAAETLLFKTLADPTRRALFERLSREGELTVGALTKRAGVSQPAVSQHLEALRLAGLVTNRRDGRAAHYRTDPRGLAPLTNWLMHYGAFRRERFDQLEKLLKEMDQ